MPEIAPMLLLASASAARAAMLRQAGVSFHAEAVPIDEAEIKLSMRAEGAKVEECAELLAQLKAERISRRISGILVIGADQMLECNGKWLDKPVDMIEARHQLVALSGRTHRLVSAVVAIRNGARVWHHIDHATLTMRPLSDSFIDDYLMRVGPVALTSVGAYQLEGLGAQLFSQTIGDYFTILGLPLLPLLQYLRDSSLLPA